MVGTAQQTIEKKGAGNSGSSAGKGWEKAKATAGKGKAGGPSGNKADNAPLNPRIDPNSPSSLRAKANWKKIRPKDLISNGSLKPRGDSLNVPGSKTDQDGRDSPRSQSDSLGSRRGSSRSLESRFSAIDLSKIQAAQVSIVSYFYNCFV